MKQYTIFIFSYILFTIFTYLVVDETLIKKVFEHCLWFVLRCAVTCNTIDILNYNIKSSDIKKKDLTVLTSLLYYLSRHSSVEVWDNAGNHLHDIVYLSDTVVSCFISTSCIVLAWILLQGTATLLGWRSSLYLFYRSEFCLIHFPFSITIAHIISVRFSALMDHVHNPSWYPGSGSLRPPPWPCETQVRTGTESNLPLLFLYWIFEEWQDFKLWNGWTILY